MGGGTIKVAAVGPVSKPSVSNAEQNLPIARMAIGSVGFCSIPCANRATKLARNRRGSDHYAWKGGRYTDPRGYIWVLVGESGYVNRYKLEHRLVMEQTLGRELSPGEQIHHINGDKHDNRPENLQLRIGPHGSGVTYCCAECGSKNIRPVKL